MNVLITGATGLVGSAVTEHLIDEGHRVTRLIRLAAPTHELGPHWVPSHGIVSLAGAGRIDAVVHLAGEPLFGLWTPDKKARIRDSRVQGTQLLCEALAALPQPPRVLISASAIGFYGDRGAEIVTEQSPPGQGFLADVCQAWEAAVAPLADRGTRIVRLRLGLVLSAKGGVLRTMVTPFRFGLGSILGSGRQFMSWIEMDDLLRLISYALDRELMLGAVNAVSPGPVSNLEFTQTLGRVVRRLTPFVIPPPVLRTVLGEMADELLLASTRVEPAQALSHGYPFTFPSLEAAIRHSLRKTHDARPRRR